MVKPVTKFKVNLFEYADGEWIVQAGREQVLCYPPADASLPHSVPTHLNIP